MYDPLELSSYLGVGDEQTVGVLVLAGDLILRQHVSQLLDKGNHFLVPGDISHGQTAGRAFPTVCHTLDTKKTQDQKQSTDKTELHKGKNKMKISYYRTVCRTSLYLQKPVQDFWGQ